MANKLAKGKYIAHVDADDYFREGSCIYQRQVEILKIYGVVYVCKTYGY